MKSTKNIRLITDVITKRTTTTTPASAKAASATAEQLNYYESACPHAMAQSPNILSTGTATSKMSETVKPYSEVPGPKPLPILGNTWRYIFRNYKLKLFGGPVFIRTDLIKIHNMDLQMINLISFDIYVRFLFSPTFNV